MYHWEQAQAFDKVYLVNNVELDGMTIPAFSECEVVANLSDCVMLTTECNSLIKDIYFYKNEAKPYELMTQNEYELWHNPQLIMQPQKFSQMEIAFVFLQFASKYKDMSSK